MKVEIGERDFLHRSKEVRKTSLGLKIKGLKMVEEMGRVYVDMKIGRVRKDGK